MSGSLVASNVSAELADPPQSLSFALDHHCHISSYQSHQTNHWDDWGLNVDFKRGGSLGGWCFEQLHDLCFSGRGDGEGGNDHQSRSFDSWHQWWWKDGRARVNWNQRCTHIRRCHLYHIFIAHIGEAFRHIWIGLFKQLTLCKQVKQQTNKHNYQITNNVAEFLKNLTIYRVRSLTQIYEGFNTPTQNFWVGFRCCFRGCACSEVEQSFNRHLTREVLLLSIIIHNASILFLIPHEKITVRKSVI